MANPMILMPTTRHLKKYVPGLRGLLEFLELHALDVYYFEDHFDGGVAAGALTTGTDPESKWSLIQNASGTATFTATIRNGVCTLDTVGATDNDYVGIYIPNTPCAGNLNTVLVARLYIPTAVTSTKVEVGFADDPANDAGIVNSLASNTFNSTNGVAAIYDTDDAGNATYWQLAGVQAGTAATKIEPQVAAPVADTYQTIVVALRGTNAKMMILNADGAMVWETAWMTDAITAATGVSPWVFLRTRAAAAKTLRLDYVKVWQRLTST